MKRLLRWQMGGIVIGTRRPDCVSDELLDYLEELEPLNRFVLVEYGIESANDETLKRINRGHDFACCRSAAERYSACQGNFISGHIIIGLPGGRCERKSALYLSSLFSCRLIFSRFSDADYQGHLAYIGIC